MTSSSWYSRLEEAKTIAKDAPKVKEFFSTQLLADSIVMAIGVLQEMVDDMGRLATKLDRLEKVALLQQAGSKVQDSQINRVVDHLSGKPKDDDEEPLGVVLG
jgi:hypothetical protein